MRAAWYGEAGSWSARALEDLRARYRECQARQERRGQAHAADALGGLISTLEALRAIDPDFHRDTIAALERAIDPARSPDRAVAPTD